MPDTYLITGGAGNLACQLTHDLVAQGHRVVLFDLAESPTVTPAAGCVYIRGDITREADIARVMREHGPTVVVHFASLLSGKSEQDRSLAWNVNMHGAFLMFEAALAGGVRQLLFPSSVASFGGTPPTPVPEDWPQWPEGLYGVTKVAVERLGVYYYRKHGLDFRCLRVPIVISPYAHAGAASSYASLAFLQAVRTGRFTFQVRPETRPALIYYQDLLKAVVQLLAAPAERLSRRVYNLQGLSPTAQQIADAIRQRLPSCQLDFQPTPPIANLIDSWPTEFDDAAARRDWHWQPTYHLETMADDFIRLLQH